MQHWIFFNTASILYAVTFASFKQPVVGWAYSTQTRFFCREFRHILSELSSGEALGRNSIQN